MITRAVCEEVFRAAVAACDPAVAVRAAVARLVPKDKAVLGVAIGKAALAMARGAGPVVRGICVAPQLDGRPLPLGWTARDAGHPDPDERSVAAGAAVLELVEGSSPGDIVLVLISGGASALVEQPTIPIELMRARIAAYRAAGLGIDKLNEVRRSLSRIKGGALAAASPGRVITLAVSDVIGDALHVIGSGPTVPPPGLAPLPPARRDDLAEVITPMRAFADAAHDALIACGIVLPFQDEPIRGPIELLAPAIETGIYWGEPTLAIPADHGEGGRAQQLALALAQQIAGTQLSAFCIGSDGVDGPPPANRPAPAGAYVDGTTCAAIRAAGIDPDAALRRRDAGTALAAVGALVITGPTGINHADVVVVG